MIGNFLKEERGQGAIEYILLAGGVIVAAVVIFSIYTGMTTDTITSLNDSVTNVSDVMGDRIKAEAAKNIGS